MVGTAARLNPVTPTILASLAFATIQALLPSRLFPIPVVKRSQSESLLLGIT